MNNAKKYILVAALASWFVVDTYEVLRVLFRTVKPKKYPNRKGDRGVRRR